MEKAYHYKGSQAILFDDNAKSEINTKFDVNFFNKVTNYTIFYI